MFSAFTYEGDIWLANGAKVPVNELLVDSSTGRIYRSISGIQLPFDQYDAYINSASHTPVDKVRFLTGSTVDITGMLTSDEKAAIRTSARSYDLGQLAPGSTGLQPYQWLLIGTLALLGAVLFFKSGNKESHVS